MIFLENTREFPEIITSNGAKFWLRLCLSVLALVIFKSPTSVIFNHVQSFSIASSLQSVWLVENPGLYWQPEGGENLT